MFTGDASTIRAIIHNSFPTKNLYYTGSSGQAQLDHLMMILDGILKILLLEQIEIRVKLL
jgi:hypothetical protein